MRLCPPSTFVRLTLFQNRNASFWQKWMFLLTADASVSLLSLRVFKGSASITECEAYSTQDGCDAGDLRKVKVIAAGSATRILILFPCFLYCPPQHSSLCATAAAWRSERLHFLAFLNALIDREYPRCQSKRGSCPRLGGDCCGSTQASSLLILLAWRRCYPPTS